MAYIFIGVDPGLKGAVAVLNREGRLVGRLRMPTHQVGSRTLVSGADLRYRLQHMVPGITQNAPAVRIESVGGIPRQSAPAAFNFGFNTGVVHGVFHGLGFADVQPISKPKWMAKAGLALGATKGDAIARARELFGEACDPLPGTRGFTDGEAEAMLIAFAAYKEHNP